MHICDRIGTCIGSLAGSGCYLLGDNDRYLFYHTPLLNYFTREKVEGEPSPMFPIDGAGSILFGAWLVIMPQFFVSILMYVLGALLVLAGAQQLISLVSARKWSTVSYVFYIIPSLILITGVMILAYPFGAAANTFVIFGVACLVYGISELINWYKFSKR